MDGLLSALQANWGGAGPALQDPGTLSGLLSLVRLWQAGELELEEVYSSLEEVTRNTAEAILETRADLQEPLAQELADGLVELEGVFLEIESELTSLRECLEHEPYSVDLTNLTSCQQRLSECARFLQDWAEAPVPRCLRCGSRDTSMRCQSCGLDCLIPVPPSEEEDVSGAYLSPEYLELYRSYRAVMDGEGPLAPMLARLGPLETSLAPLERLARMTGSPILGEVERSLRGIQQMRQVTSSRLASDLSQGWEQVFQGALALKSLMPQLLREQGLEEEARRLEQDQRSSDGISLGLR